MFESLGPFVYRHRWATLIASGLFLVVAFVLLFRGGAMTSGHIRGLEAERAQALVTEVLGHPQDATFIAAFSSKDLDPDDDAFQAAMAKALEPLRKDPRIASVVTADNAPVLLGDSLTNSEAHAALALITFKGDVAAGLKSYPEIRKALRSETLQIACTGEIPFTSDLNHTLESDLLRAELLSIPLALLVLLLVFRTLIASLLPVGVGGLAVVGGVAIVTALSRTMDIAQYTINVCSLIGLGVAIDYSLFTVSRYREELDAGHDYKDALARAVSTAGRVVAFSGIAVGTGLSGLLFFEHSYLEAMGIGGAIVVALAALFALTFLPALLAVLGPRIHALRILRPRKPGPGRFWSQTANAVMRRPLLVLLPTLAVLLCMGVPFLHLRMARADVHVLSGKVEARAGYELLRRDFPTLAQNREVVVVQFPSAPALTAERIGALYDLSRRIARIPGVAQVQSIVDDPNQPQMSRAAYIDTLTHPPPMYRAQIEAGEKLLVHGGTVLMYALTQGDADSDAARQVVRAIRSNRQVADGTLVVTGQTAEDVDSTAYVLARAPRAVAFVVVVTLLVLFALLGSVLLPLKAVLMNFVSIAGSFGALVWVFQDGHLFIREPRPIEPSLPVLLFCVIFGLSMDYEVLMLSRMKEVFERKGDNTAAVAEGLERSAGLITSAAAIMVAVFLAFTLARVVLIQAVGFGMALAVALDATLVRVLLVPATMRLLGKANWWAPAPLQKLRRALKLDAPMH